MQKNKPQNTNKTANHKYCIMSFSIAKILETETLKVGVDSVVRA